MTRFSASDAALEGFNLLRRRWSVVLGWAGFNLVALFMVIVLTVVLGVVAAGVSGGASGPVRAVGGLVILLGTLAIEAILAGGVFRLALRPEEQAFLHLRLGRDELRLVCVWLIYVLALWLASLPAVLLAGALAARPVAGLAAVLAGLAVVVYLGLRFALVAPISFAEHRIDFFRSWRLTRGRTMALLGMSVLSFCLMALLVVLVAVALAIVAGGVGGLEAIGSLFRGGQEALKQHPGLYALHFAVQIVMTPVLWVLALTPLVAAYRAFAGDAETG